MLSSCSDDDNKGGEVNGGGSEPKEKVLTGYTLFGSAEDERLPITIDGVDWTYGADGEMNTLSYYMTSYIAKYSDNKIELIDTRIKGNVEVSDTVSIFLKDGRISKKITTNHYYEDYTTEHKYYYDEAGFLVRISEINVNNQERDFYKATVENGNVVKVMHMEYSLWGTEPFSTETYTYTYDNNAYVPMSDWGPFTPIYFAHSQLLKIYDGLLGTKSKNNIMRLDVVYTGDQFSPRFNYITFEPEFDEDDRLVCIKHTGQYVGWKSEGSPIVNFSKATTTFRYTEKN